MSERKILAIMTNILGDRVVVGEGEVLHAIKEHFENLPVDILLELIERILKDPIVVYEEKVAHLYHLFYRIEDEKYLVVVVKKNKSGALFSSIYPTGKKMRNKHKKFRKVEI